MLVDFVFVLRAGESHRGEGSGSRSQLPFGKITFTAVREWMIAGRSQAEGRMVVP